MTLVPFARQSKADGSHAGYSGERLVNYFLRPADGVTQGVLIGRSGLRASYDLGGPVRAIINHNADPFAVANGKLWRLNADGSAESLGAVPDDAATSAVSSGTQIAIVAGGKYYLYSDDELKKIAIPVLEVAVSVTYQDGYFIVGGTGSGRRDLFTISALDDGATFDPLEFAAAESNADRLVAIVSDHGQVWAFGAETVEVYYNSGDAAFPFVPNMGSKVEKGCLSGATVARADNALFFVGSDRAVYRLMGASPQVVSTREIEDMLVGQTITGAFAVQDRGHWFYVVNRDGQTSLCLDITTGLWGERSTGDVDAAWIATCAGFVDGVQYVGTSTGSVCTNDQSLYEDDGVGFIAEAVSVPVESKGELFPLGKVYVQVDTGIDALDRTPQIMLQVSGDGRTWGVEKWRDLQDIGHYYRRALWHGLGAFRRFQVKVRISDPVKRDLIGLSYE